MSNLTRAMMMGAAGASGDKVYVDDVFSTYLFVGSASPVTITNGLDLSGEGGMIWIKARTSTASHTTSSSANNYYGLMTPNTNAADADSTTQYVRGTSTGFQVTMGNITPNDAGEDMASWSFRKAPGFFDVVTYTGNGVAARQISHSLGSIPGCIIVKRTDATGNWGVYHRSLPNDGSSESQSLILNSTSDKGGYGFLNTHANQTSTYFTTRGSVAGDWNINGATYVAYIFAHDDAQYGTGGNESIIKCGTYTGSSSGVNINLGFEPQWVMVKRTNGSGSWYIMDTMRGFTASDNPVTLKPNSTDAEGGLAKYRITSTGFDWNSDSGDSGQTYIYMAIRRPHKPPTAATEVFAMDTGNGSTTIPAFDSGFPVDLAIRKEVGGLDSNRVLTRLQTSLKVLFTNSAFNEQSDSNSVLDSNSGHSKNFSSSYQSWMFKRAPGFMDVVAYTGTNAVQTVSHNLTVIPELIFCKRRDSGGQWPVYYGDEEKALFLDDNVATETNISFWNNTSPTSTVFTLKDNQENNANNGTFIAILFATLPGISKVGSYTGTGNDINVDCGFTSGARFVLIKRTNSSGNWVLFDSLRGIVGGNDPYIKLNTTSAQTTDENHLAPLNAGFTVSSSSEGDTNANGGEYIFLAVA